MKKVEGRKAEKRQKAEKFEGRKAEKQRKAEKICTKNLRKKFVNVFHRVYGRK